MMIQKQRSQEDSELYSQVEYISPVNTLCIPFLLQPLKAQIEKEKQNLNVSFLLNIHSWMWEVFYTCFQDLGIKSLELFILLSFCKY